MSTATNKVKGPRASESTKVVAAGPTGGFGDIVRIFTDAKVRREYAEMVAFVLVLVCFLRLFGAEAYVIPTGSMAPTLLGAHKVGVCPQCGQVNYVNASHEAEEGRVTGHGLCQNCQYLLSFGRGGYAWGDRILADKLVYEFRDPRRWDVAVFKYPGGIEGRGAGIRSGRSNYIKRVVGLPNETIGIEFGDLFGKSNGGVEFDISRKPPPVIMATRRLVFDNEKLPKDLVAENAPPRWASADSAVWTATDDGRSFVASGEGNGWLGYRHLLRLDPDRPSLILDFEAYNTDLGNSGTNWVGDLMLEANVLPQSDQGTIVFELVEGERTLQCVFDMGSNSVVLLDGESEVARADNPLNVGDKSQVRFANVDDQLVLWVDDDLVFGDGVPVRIPTKSERGPTMADFHPVRIGSKGAQATISQLKIFRDIYYRKSSDGYRMISFVHQGERVYGKVIDGARGDVLIDSSNPSTRLRFDDITDYQLENEPIVAPYYSESSLRDLRNNIQTSTPRSFQTGAEQYFVLGDNSPASADARDWREARVVDRRLILGRAIARYWPVLSFHQGGWPTLKWKFVR